MRRIKTYEELEWKDLNLVKKYKDKNLAKKLREESERGFKILCDSLKNLEKNENIESIEIGDPREAESYYPNSIESLLTITASKKFTNEISSDIVPTESVKALMTLIVTGGSVKTKGDITYLISSKYYKNVDKISDDYKMRKYSVYPSIECPVDKINDSIISTCFSSKWYGIKTMIDSEVKNTIKAYIKYNRENKFEEQVPEELIKDAMCDIIDMSKSHSIDKSGANPWYICRFKIDGIKVYKEEFKTTVNRSGRYGSEDVKHTFDRAKFPLIDKNLEILNMLSIARDRLHDVDPELQMDVEMANDYLEVRIYIIT